MQFDPSHAGSELQVHLMTLDPNSLANYNDVSRGVGVKYGESQIW
jgi:hypothetical protein